MSSSDAQRSGVHQSTEDSNAEPTGAAAAKSKPAAPEGAGQNAPGRDGQDDTRVKNDPDESSFGGPLDLDEPKGA